MSFADPESDVAQPDLDGQGDGGQSDAPYREYLDRIPEEVRGDVEPVFKDWDANVTRRFQDASEFRKQWEPLADTGVNQLSKDQVAYAVQLFQALEDPQVMQQWWEGYAQQNGLTQKQAEEVQQAATLDDFGSFQDPSQQLEKLLEERLSPLNKQLEEYRGRFEQQDQAQREAEATRYIEGQINELEAKHGEFNDETKELINTLAGKYVESDPMNAIPKAYEDLIRLSNQIEKRALQAKVDAPAPAESGGVPDVSPPQHSRIDSPGVIDAAREFLRNSNRA